MGKVISGTWKRLSEKLHICECTRDSERPQGFWLYDEVAGRNLAMGEPDRDKAFVKAIEYWQKRCLRAEGDLSALNAKVDAFVDQFRPVDPED